MQEIECSASPVPQFKTRKSSKQISNVLMINRNYPSIILSLSYAFGSFIWCVFCFTFVGTALQNCKEINILLIFTCHRTRILSSSPQGRLFSSNPQVKIKPILVHIRFKYDLSCFWSKLPNSPPRFQKKIETFMN